MKIINVSHACLLVPKSYLFVHIKLICTFSLYFVGWIRLKALVWFWLIDETLSANLVYQSDYEIGSTTPSDEAMTKIMTMVIAW